MKQRWKLRSMAAAPWSVLALLALSEMAIADPMDELIAAAKNEGQLTVIALPRDWCGYGAMIDAFEAKYGLTVNELYPTAGSAQELEAIREGRNRSDPQGPDVIDVGLSFGAAAKKEGLLHPYKVSTWDKIPEAAKDADGYWYGDYYGLLAFEINADIIKKAPADWSDLLASEYRNSVALAGRPQSSNEAIQAVYAAGLSATNGNTDRVAAAGLEFFAELHKKGNFIPLVGGIESLTQGATPILIRWDYLALGDRDRLAGNPNIKIIVPKTGVVGGVYVQAISASAPHPNAAKLWMEHLYSDEGQLAWLNGYCRPIRLDDLIRNNKVPVNLLEKLPPEGDGQGSSNGAVFPTLEELEKAKETITNGWDAVVGVKVRKYHPDAPSSLNDAASKVFALP
jgi:putative spermidine/putrescine transport system substrate-binding protein